MRKWVATQLRDIGDLAHEIIVVLDPDDALSEHDFDEIRKPADLHIADDWLTLRRI